MRNHILLGIDIAVIICCSRPLILTKAALKITLILAPVEGERPTPEESSMAARTLTFCTYFAPGPQLADTSLLWPVARCRHNRPVTIFWCPLYRLHAISFHLVSQWGPRTTTRVSELQGYIRMRQRRIAMLYCSDRLGSTRSPAQTRTTPRTPSP